MKSMNNELSAIVSSMKDVGFENIRVTRNTSYHDISCDFKKVGHKEKIMSLSSKLNGDYDISKDYCEIQSNDFYIVMNNSMVKNRLLIEVSV